MKRSRIAAVGAGIAAPLVVVTCLVVLVSVVLWNLATERD